MGDTVKARAVNKALARSLAVSAQRCEALLWYLHRHRDRAVPAIELAGPLQVSGSREYRRRVVRRAVQVLHACGCTICADNHPTLGGYWLSRDDAEWAAYKETRRRGARWAFAGVSKMARASRERKDGQGILGDWDVRRDCEC